MPNQPKTGTVFNTKPYAVDLDDGRLLEASATAENVKVNNPHNAALLDAGTIVLVDGEDDDEPEADEYISPNLDDTSDRVGLGPQEV